MYNPSYGVESGRWLVIPLASLSFYSANSWDIGRNSEDLSKQAKALLRTPTKQYYASLNSQRYYSDWNGYTVVLVQL
jgi:hypothetical protein